MVKKSFMTSVFRFLLLLFLCSCSVGEPDASHRLASSYLISGVGYRFTSDPVKFQRLDFNRRGPAECQVDYELKGMKRQGNELTLEIERPKGCAGKYQLVWDGIWQESSPRRMQVYLTASFESCVGSVETERDVITIDLASAVQGEPKDLFTIYLREHCSFRDFNCVGNCDLSI
jgi:hypothetical protein